MAAEGGRRRSVRFPSTQVERRHPCVGHIIFWPQDVVYSALTEGLDPHP